MKWIGVGCIRIDKVDYVYGDTIPKNKLTKERLDELIALGKIGEIPTPIKANIADNLKLQNDNLVAEKNDLLKANNDLSVELQKLRVEYEELIKTKGGKQVKARIEELEFENESLKVSIEELTKEDNKS
jgi:hypothetical protein